MENSLINPMQSLERYSPPQDSFGNNPHMPVWRLAASYFRGKRLILSMGVIGAGIAGCLAILKPDVYMSSAQFMYTQGSENLAVRPEMDDGRPRNRPSISQNAVILLQSPEVVKQTVAKAGIDRILSPYRPKMSAKDASGPMGAVRSWIHGLQRKFHEMGASKPSERSAMRAFKSRFGIQNINNTNLLQLRYMANDPHLAQTILQDYVEVAKKYHQQLYSDPTAFALVEAQSKDADLAYTEAKGALAAFKTEHQIQDFNEEYKQAQIRRNASQKELQDLQQKVNTHKQEILTLGEQLAEVPEYLAKELGNPELAELLKKRALLKVKLGTLRGAVQPGSSQIKSVERQIDRMNELIALERKRVIPVEEQASKIPNPQHAKVLNMLNKAKLDLNLNRGKLIACGDFHATNNEECNRFARESDNYHELDISLDIARKNRDKALYDLKRAEHKKVLETNELSSLTLVSQPSFIERKVKPIRSLEVIFGLLAGIFLAIAILTVRTLTDTTVRTPEELEAMVGLRVLATVPQLDKKNLTRHEKHLSSGC